MDRAEALERKRVRGRAHYAANKEAYRLRLLARNRKRYADIVQALGGCCACCSEDWLPYLQIDHIDGGGTQLIGKSASTEYRRIARDPANSGCQVLCANCHQAKTRKQGCQHKEGGGE